MPDAITFLEASTGVNAVINTSRMSASDLEYALDVIITDSGMVESSDGHTLLTSLTSGHSLYCNKGPCLLAQGTSLYQVADDNVLGGAFVTGMSGGRIDFARYGHDIYYVNGVDNGRINGDARSAWTVDIYNGPTSLKYWETTVPVFDHIGMLHSKMLGAVGNALFEAEPGYPGLWNLKLNWLFATRIIMIKPVAGGVFVSDEQETWFLAGTSIENFVPTLVADYPAYEWSAAIDTINGKKIGFQESSECALWDSPEGPCLGTADGGFFNLTEDKVIYPDNAQAAATILRGHHLISTLDASDYSTDVNLKVGDLGGKAITQRSGFPFNSYCKRGSDYLACGASGLYLLGGATHAGTAFDSTVETRTWDMDYDGKKSVHFIYVDITTSNNFTITPIVDGTEYTAITVTPPGTGKQTIRVKDIGKGIVGNNWKLKIVGRDFSLDKVQVLPVHIARGR